MRKLFVLFLVFALPAFAQPDVPPAPTRYVTDVANVLDDEREEALNEKLAQYEHETTNQFIVYVDRKLPAGVALEDYTLACANAWGIGQKDKNNGVVLFLFIDDRKSRIEVGSGLESVLTNDRASQILIDIRKPLRDGDTIGAVEQAVLMIIDAIENTNAP